MRDSEIKTMLKLFSLALPNLHQIINRKNNNTATLIYHLTVTAIRI